MKAAANGELEPIKKLLATTEDVDAADSSGWTALMYAAASSHSDPVQLLLAAAAGLTEPTITATRPSRYQGTLYAAAMNRRSDVLGASVAR